MSTNEVASRLECSVWRLYSLLRENKIAEPPRLGRPSGPLVWSERHVEEARKLLEAKRATRP